MLDDSSLQPPITLHDLLEPPMHITSAKVLLFLEELVRTWSRNQRDLPDFFDEEVQVASASRQPVVFVSVDAQRVDRNVESVDEPLGKRQLDRSAWPTTNLFDLTRFQPTAFPTQLDTQRENIRGREQLVNCDQCAGLGQIECSRCSSAGAIPCEVCSASGQAKCAACDGSGLVTGANLSLINCRSCRGSGLVSCTNCHGNGSFACPECSGDARQSCTRCEGEGQFRRRWVLVTQTSTRNYFRTLSSEQWPADLKQILAETTCITSRAWPLINHSNSQPDFSTLVPTQLLPLTSQLVDTAMSGRPAPDDANSQLTGIRIALQATYLYRVEIEHLGKRGIVFVGGTANRVIPHVLPRRSNNLVAQMLRGIDSVFSLVGLGVRTDHGKVPRSSTQEAPVHPFDTDRVVAGLRAHGSTVTLSEDGYTIKSLTAAARSRSASYAGADHPEICFKIDENGQKLIWIRSRLGDAPRERFPEALALSRELDIGHVALMIDPKNNREEFVLTARRYYQWIDTTSLFWLLIAFESEANRIVRDGLLR